ncbi:hypothetical protein [Roseburia inulinivorans]
MARSNARLEVSGAGKIEDGLVQYNEEVNKLGDDLRELYETIRVNVDEEEQWKVFDFVEDFFMEELEIGDYINDINSYHLHMFGKHDVTTKKLDVIVEKAGKVDANYAAQIEGYCSLLGEYGKKFEAVCAMLALDLIGVKVFRYSDETAEAVKSGEKLLKESGTIYESFADMMSPDDAEKYLDFLANGSREGLTSAELAGVEKADALLVSRKVEYEDVWDLRNADDLLESGRKTIDYIKLSDELGRKIENDGYKIIDIKDAAIANAEWADMGYDLTPVAAGTKVYNVAAGNFQYARVFKEGVNKPKSPFILRADDIQGLSAIEIAEKYALPQTPDKIAYPKIPSDVPLEISIVGPQKTWGTLGGDAQYAIKGVLLDDDWFTDIHDLK